MRKFNIYSSLFLLFLATAVCISAHRLSLYGQRGPGPGFVSFWIGVLLFVLSLHFLLKNLFFFKGEAGKGVVLINWKLNMLIIGMLIFYAVTLERLGFLLGVFMLISVLFAVSKTMKWYMVVGSALLIAVASHILFYVLLRIGLPLGVLSFLR